MHRIALLAVVTLGWLWVTPALAFNNTCWCDPRAPWAAFSCATDWEIRELATGHNNLVCNGTPPGGGGMIFIDPHPCPELATVLTGGTALYYPGGHTQNPTTYQRGAPDPPPFMATFALVPGIFSSNTCLVQPDLFPPTMINIWPGILAQKQSFANALASNMRLLKDLQARLAAAPAFGPQWRGLTLLIANVVGTTAQVLAAMKDPLNPNYMQVPLLPVLPPGVPLIAEGDLTAAQADALNAWGLASRKLMQRLAHFSATVDVLAGALDEPDPALIMTAKEWTRRHAAALDLIAVKVGAKGADALAARSALAVAWPTVAVPAACLTGAQVGAMTPDVVALDVGLAALADFHQWAQPHVCQPASHWPDVLLEAAADWAVTWAWAGDLRPATTVCDTIAVCSSVTTITSSPLPPAPGKIKEQVTVTSVGVHEVSTTAGLIVTVSIPGLAPVPDLVLVNGTVKLAVLGVPAGPYTVTLTFPEQVKAKFRASTLVVPVVVQ